MPAWIFPGLMLLVTCGGVAGGPQMDQPGAVRIYKTTFLRYQFPNNQSRRQSEPASVEVGFEVSSGGKRALELGLANDSGCQVKSTTWLTTNSAEAGVVTGGRVITARFPLHGIILGQKPRLLRTQGGWTMSVCLRDQGDRWQVEGELLLPHLHGQRELRDGSNSTIHQHKPGA